MSVKLRTKQLKGGRKSFYLDIYSNGNRRYEFLNIKINPKEDSPDKRKEKITIAETIRSQRDLEISSSGTAYVPNHKKRIDFITYYKGYLASYTKRDLRMVKYSFEKFCAFVGKDVLLTESLTESVCEGFKDYLLSKKCGLSGETPQNYFARFKKVLKVATKTGILKSNPSIDIEFKGSTDALRKEILTNEELQTLASTSCSSDEVKKTFLFACFTGLGIAEIRKLKWSNINNGRLKTYREKTGTEINIPLSETALELIGARKANKEFVFKIELSDVSISKHLKRWVTNAEINKNVSFYCGRHTFAVQLLMNKANLKTVSDCMGHTNTRHTIKYLNYVDSLKNDAIGSLTVLKL